jgi:NADH-quinone oxidoreductase subunit J
LLGARVDRLQPGSADLKPGMAGYLLPFELVSVHLLVVLVGAAYLARTKRRAKPQREA